MSRRVGPVEHYVAYDGTDVTVLGDLMLRRRRGRPSTLLRFEPTAPKSGTGVFLIIAVGS